jgi:uncharacterized protein (DUF924 family)
METFNAVREFWFGTSLDDAEVADSQGKRWWMKNESTDATIRERFGTMVEAEANGGYDDRTSPADLLVRIILLDQFTRNIFRGSGEAFAYDARARNLSNEVLRDRKDTQLRPIERVFVYLPYEHSESAKDQETSIRLYTELRDDAPDSQRSTFAGYLDYAEQHKAIIGRFGRYPHRNAVVGRDSTAAESAFLEEPGSSF